MSRIDVPYQCYVEDQSNMAGASIPLEPFVPPPEYGKGSREAPAPVHNHYHIGSEVGPTPWYRRKWAFWTMMGTCALIVVAGLVALGVVLKIELSKKGASAANVVDNMTSTSSATATPATTSTSRHVSSTTTTTTSTASSTATPFTMSEKSQLASAYFKAKDATQSRRLLVRQEDTNELVITEWANDNTTYYRLKDKLGAFATEAKPGTPLSLLADDIGTLHLFYLSRTNILTYAYETTPGKWKTAEVSNEYGTIRTSSYSSLSTAWHNGRKAAGLLVVAFDNASQRLQLAVTGDPAEKGSWYIADVTSLDIDSAPGQSNVPCYSLAGDWYNTDTDRADGGYQRLLLAVMEANEAAAWECAVDFWPPPDVQSRCRKVAEVFRDGQGRNLTLVPPAKQFSWINLNDGPDKGFGNYDFTMFSLDGSGTVHENSVGAGITRSTGPGFTANMPIRAMSTTNDGIVFISSGKDVLTYRKSGSRWQQDVGTNVSGVTK